MQIASTLPTTVLVIACGAAFVGCASAAAESDDAAENQSAIQAGAQAGPATAFPESVRVRMNDGNYCTGEALAPDVIVTAAHCLLIEHADGTWRSWIGANRTWTVDAPFASGGDVQIQSGISGPQTPEPTDAVTTTLAEVYPDAAENPQVPSAHDIGLLYLPTPLAIDTFPTLRRSWPTTVADTVVVGRKLEAPGADLVVTRELVAEKSPNEWSNTWKLPFVTFGGDSGGGLFIKGTQELLGIETLFFDSGPTTGDYYTRIEGAVYDWVATKLAAHGHPITQP